MNKDTIEIENKFNELLPLYERLGENIRDALKQFLNEHNIDYVDVEFRVKSFKSFYEKIQRKKYANPFSEIQDICGLRIINYYPSDLDKISTLIKSEFNVSESIDKQNELEEDRFGYRSYHFIATLKKDWLRAPNYRGLEDINFEIQARTILMHGWASINHKLLYKQESDIPPEFRRDLFRLSALIELADEQFERLREERKEYAKDTIKYEKDGKLIIDKNQSLNVDSLQAILDYYFGDRQKSENLSELIEDIKDCGLTLYTLNQYIVKSLHLLRIMEKEEMKTYMKDFKEDDLMWIQVGVVRAVLNLFVPQSKIPESITPPEEIQIIRDKYRKKIK